MLDELSKRAMLQVADSTSELFPQRLRYAIKFNNYTINDLAKDLDTGWTTVGNWVKGKTSPESYSLVRLAFIFGVTTDWLLGLSEIGGPRKCTGTQKNSGH